MSCQYRLIVQGLRARPLRALVGGLVALVLAATATALIVSSSTVLAVVRHGALGSAGGHEYVVGQASDTVTDFLGDRARAGEAVAQARAAGLATAEGSASDATLTLLSGPSGYGDVVGGRRPDSTGEASVTAELARRLGVGVGSTIDLASEDLDTGDGSFTVVGIVINPASPTDTEAVAVADASLVVGQATAWLTDTDPCSLARFETVCAAGNVSTTTREALVERADAEVRTRLLAGVRPFTLLLFLAACVGLGTLMLSDRAAARPVSAALEAAGASRRRARLLARAGTAVTLGLGTALGVCLSYAVLAATRPAIGERLSQRWEHLDLSLGRVLLFIAAYVLAAAAIDAALGRYRQRGRRPLTPLRLRRRPLLWLGSAAGVLLSVVLVYLRLEAHHRLPEGNALGVLLLSLSLPALLWLMPWLRRLPVHDAVVRHGLGALVPVLMMTMMLQGFAAFYSASVWSSVGSGVTGGTDRSFTAESLTAQDVTVLRGSYPDIMSEAVVLTSVAEDGRQPRAARAEDGSCALASCFSALGTIALAPEEGAGASWAGTASAEVGGASGAVALVWFTPSTDVVESTTELAVAAGPRALDSHPQLPDVVLAPDDPQLAEQGLRPSDGRVVFIEDFQAFPARERDRFRSDVMTRAGYAWVTEADSAESRQLLSMAVVVPLLAALLTTAALGLGLVALLERLAPLIRMLDDHGAPRWAYLRLLLPAAVVLVGCSAAPVVLARWAAQPAVSMSVTNLPHDFGAWWWTPATAGTVVGVVALMTAARLARRARPRESLPGGH